MLILQNINYWVYYFCSSIFSIEWGPSQQLHGLALLVNQVSGRTTAVVNHILVLWMESFRIFIKTCPTNSVKQAVIVLSFSCKTHPIITLIIFWLFRCPLLHELDLVKISQQYMNVDLAPCALYCHILTGSSGKGQHNIQVMFQLKAILTMTKIRFQKLLNSS
jgi:hypothetical protein